MTNYEIVATALNLLSTIRFQELDLINQLNGCFGFDHNIFLLDSLTHHHHRYIATSSSKVNHGYTPQTVFSFDEQSPDKDMVQLHQITSKNTLLIVVVESLNFERNNLQFLSQIREILDRKTNVKIGVFFARSVTSMNDVKKFFRWSWSHNILNIFSAFYLHVEGDNDTDEPLLNVFKFNPFGTFNMINVTRSASPFNYFPDGRPNFRQHPLRFAKFREQENHILERIFWDIVVRKFNATPRFLSATKSLAVKDGIIPYEVTMSNSTQFHQLYPHRSARIVLLVPHAQTYSNFIGLLKSVTSESFFGYIFIAILSSTVLLIMSRYLHKTEILLFESVADVMNLLMNDNATIRYRQLRFADACIIVPLTFVGLIITNGIVSLFQSYVTLPRYQPQIETVDDLYKSQVPILINEFVWYKELTRVLDSLSHHGQWSAQIRPLNSTQLGKEMESFSNFVAIAMFDETAKVLLEAQKQLNLKAYHVMSETNIMTYILLYRTQTNFFFIEYLNDIIHRYESAGLFDKLMKNYRQEMVGELLKRNLNVRLRTSNDAQFTIPTVIWIDWTASVIVFICEIIWQKFKSAKIFENLKKKLSWMN